MVPQKRLKSALPEPSWRLISVLISVNIALQELFLRIKTKRGMPGVAKAGARHSAGLNGQTTTPNHTEPPPLIRSIRTPHLRACVKKQGGGGKVTWCEELLCVVLAQRGGVAQRRAVEEQSHASRGGSRGAELRQ
jgi:hypothetical protein